MSVSLTCSSPVSSPSPTRERPTPTAPSLTQQEKLGVPRPSRRTEIWRAGETVIWSAVKVNYHLFVYKVLGHEYISICPVNL